MNQIPPKVRKTENERSPIFSGGLALGLGVGVPAGIILMLGWEFFLETLTIDSPAELIGVFAALAALTSSTLAFLALSEQKKGRQAGTDPVILVHLGKRPDQPMVITFEISNVGAGAALNTSVQVDAAVQDFDPSRLITNPSKLTHPIRVIRQNESISYSFGVGHQLLGDTPLPPFTVAVRYEDIEGNRYTSTQMIDVRELSYQAANTPVTTKVAQHLEKIAKELSPVLKGQKYLHIVTQSRDNYLRTQDEELRQLSEFYEQNKDK